MGDMRKLITAITGPFELRQCPWVLFCAALLLVGVGGLFVWSAHSAGLAVRHLMFGGAGVCIFFLVALIDYRHLAGLAIWLYTMGIASLLLLPVFGVTINQARRWYSLGPINVQPSEPMKYITVLTVATYFTYRERLDRLRDLVLPLVLTLIPMFLIVQQPDLGTSLLFLPAFLGIAYVGRVPVRNLLVLVLLGIAVCGAAWYTPGVIKDYQRERVLTFVQPDAESHSAASYNARQATLAIAGGGFEGQGWGTGLLNQLRRIPERHTDFIFPVIAEEWGFVRTASIILFYLMMIYLIVREIWRTPDRFGRLVICGVLMVFGFQSLLHMGISLRLAPITGLTLPLISYGGSSLVSTFAGFGLVASVAMRRRVIFPDRRMMISR
ncbi:MAG: FtsW/RodA/SpoVE family cell cycle protein [Candidatus Brocadiia bacterium]